MSFAQRQGVDWSPSLRDEAMQMTADAGLDAFEDLADSPAAVESTATSARRIGVSTPSFYSNVRLHDADAEAQVERYAKVAASVANIGGSYLNVNAEPVDWNKPLDKNDEQLARQAAAMIDLQAACLDVGITLAYHTHDAEMRQAAREVHHMLLNVPDLQLCFDPDWFYAGTGMSLLATIDWARLWGSRTVMLHLRDRVDGTWAETFGDGEIDYDPVLAGLPHVPDLWLLEQAVDPERNLTMQPAAALERSVANLRSAADRRMAIGSVHAG
jgi:inosose dehydratase